MVTLESRLVLYVFALFGGAMGFMRETVGLGQASQPSYLIGSRAEDPGSNLSVELNTCENKEPSLAKIKTYTAVVGFGASDVDNAHPRPSYYNNTLRGPPYFKGRFTNGRVFIEYLAQGFLTGHNISLFDYAYGDATISNKLVNVAAPDTAAQTHSYLHDVKHNLINRVGKDGSGRVLHIFWIGTNDVIQIWQDVITNGTFAKLESRAITGGFVNRTEKEFTIARKRIDAEVTTLMKQVANLRHDTSVNQVASDILILTLPPLETVPNLFYHSQELAMKNISSKVDKKTLTKMYQTYVGELAAKFNHGIINGVKALKKDACQTGLKSPVVQPLENSTFIKVFDTVSLWNYVHKNPAKCGFENVVDACWNSTTGGICQNPDRWEYWDTLHISTSMHKFLAHKLIAS